MNAPQLRRVDPTLLLIFAETLRRRKLSAAADRLGLTPSAVSHALGRLRALFGDALFVRRPHGVEPTARALELGPRVEAALEALQALLVAPEPFDPRATERVFKLSGLDTAASLLLPDLVRTLRVEAPRAVLSFRPLARETALASLASGDLDLALGFFPRETPGIETEVLFEETYGVVMRADRPDRPRSLDLDGYAAFEHLLVSQDGEPRGVVDDALERVGLRRRVAATAPNFFAALAAAAATDLVLTLPRRFAERWAGRFDLVVHDPPLAIRPFTVAMAWRARDAGDGGLAWLRARLRSMGA